MRPASRGTMLEILESFRIQFGGRPLLLTIAAAALLLVFRRARDDARATVWWTILASRVLAIAGVAGLGAYFLVSIWYAATDHYFDNAEPTMTAVGWLFRAGKPVYHALESAERYAHIYGPASFIAHGFVLGAFGPSIIVSKALGVAAALGALALLAVTLRSEVGAVRAMVLTGICALLLLLFRNYSFWTRPEPLQLFCVSAALLFAVRANGIAAAVASGVCAGILLDLKFTGPLYALPPFVILQRRAGLTPAVVALAAALATAVLPFAVFPNLSWIDYAVWIRLSARTGLLLSTLRANIEWAAFLWMPVLLSYYAAPSAQRPRGRHWPPLLLSLGAATCGVVLAAAKPGAGPYHLIPLLPLIVYVVAHQLKAVPLAEVTDPVVPAAAIAFVAVAVAIGTAQQAQLVSIVTERARHDEVAEIAGFARAHAGVVEMGYGSSEALTLARPVLVFRNNSYLLDQPAVREHQLAGLALPGATIAAVRECRASYWLIPKGESPFSGRNVYDAAFLAPLFPEEFRRAFLDTYERAGTTAYYDVWKCRTEPAR